MKIGDVSRQRRFADAARQRWYVHHRAVRFAFHMTGRRPEQVSFPEPMSRVKEDYTELYYQEAGTGPEPLVLASTKWFPEGFVYRLIGDGLRRAGGVSPLILRPYQG